MSLIHLEQLDAMCRMAGEMPAGNFVEVGVYRGGSALRLAAVAQGRSLWLFDTFTGIPCRAADDQHEIGDFGDCSEAEVRALLPDAVFVVGDCRVTLDRALFGPVAFAHIDCDQYESISACIKAIAPRMAAGGVMWFDDYEHLAGARRAVDEAFGGRVEMDPCGKFFVRF